MIMRQDHLSDDRLIDVCLDGRGLAADERHLAACPACEERRARLARLLTEVSGVAAAQADAVFTDERLAKQRTRILQRIDQEARLGRVISFPASQGHAQSLRARPGMRWVAGAAAAGLLIGLVAEHVAHRLPGGPVASAPATIAAVPQPEALQFVAAPLSEEEFLGRIEMATEGTAGTALRPLDDLTPLVWEVAAQ